MNIDQGQPLPSMNANPGLNDTPAIQKLAHQGEKRKRDGEQLQPSESGLTGSVTRQRIVQILSNTANGCLSELGYYPGMAGRMKELETQNLKWRDENVKLYQDNQRLTQMVQNLNANIALSGISESDKTTKIFQMQNEINRLQHENEHGRKLLHLPQQHEILVAKYNQLVQSHQSIVQENQTLKNHLHGLAAQPQVAQQHPQQISTINPHALLHRTDQIPQFPAQAQHSSSSRPTSAQSLQRGLNQILQTELTQTQFAVVQHRQHPHSNPSSRRSSMNFVSPIIQPTPGPLQPFNPTIPPNCGPQIQHHGLDASRQQALLIEANLRHNIRRASAPNTPILQGNLFPQSLFPRFPSDAVESGSAQPAVPSQASQVLPPTISNASNVPMGNFVPAPPGSSFNVLQNNSNSQIQDAEPTVVTAISPQDMHINPSPMMQIYPTSHVSPQPLPVQNSSSRAVQQADVMFIPSSSSTSTSLPHSGSSDSYISPVPENPSKSVDNASLSAEYSTTNSKSADSVAVPQDTHGTTTAEGNAMEVDTAEDDEEEEEEAELGPDGLRLVKDCLSHIFGTPVEGHVICRLCEHRFKKGFQDKPPNSFINATDTELEKHCIEEHEKPWEALRKP